MLPDGAYNLKIITMNTILSSKHINVSDSLAYIESQSELFTALKPFPTNLSPVLSYKPDVKALLFDIYGTLLISEAGDIGLTALDRDNKNEIFVLDDGSSEKVVTRNEIRKTLTEIIKRHHAQTLEDFHGIEYPEVDIISVWADLFKRYQLDNSDIKFISRAALLFELLSNKVDLMPGVIRLLKYLQKTDYLLGIISNAQFYTPLLMEYLCGMSLETFGFSEKFTSWSYQMRCGKPDTEIFRKPVEALNREGIQNHEILYIGNDMLNDISCAASHGLKTVLFAGDQRSLRLRENDPRVQVSADYIITDLMQLKQILQDGVDG